MKIAILGDSISQGLGSKLYNYCEDLKINLEKENFISINIKNFAYSGTTIFYPNEIVKDIIEFNPDIVLSFYGNVDGMIRPKTTGKVNFYSLLPKRYKKNGMLDPRPFFSSNWKRRIFEYIDSYIRYNLKKILLKLQGGYCWVELDSFYLQYQKLLNKLNNGNRLFFLVSTVIVDEYYFPGTNKSYDSYNSIIENLCDNERIFYINLKDELAKYTWSEVFGNDHFHPNQNGYKIIANYFSSIISKQL